MPKHWRHLFLHVAITGAACCTSPALNTNAESQGLGFTGFIRTWPQLLPTTPAELSSDSEEWGRALLIGSGCRRLWKRLCPAPANNAELGFRG